MRAGDRSWGGWRQPVAIAATVALPPAALVHGRGLAARARNGAASDARARTATRFRGVVRPGVRARRPGPLRAQLARGRGADRSPLRARRLAGGIRARARRAADARRPARRVLRRADGAGDGAARPALHALPLDRRHRHVDPARRSRAPRALALLHAPLLLELPAAPGAHLRRGPPGGRRPVRDLAQGGDAARAAR